MRIVSKLQKNISASYLRQLRKTLLRRYESILWILVIPLNFKGRESVIWNSIQLQLLLLANLGQVFTGVSIEACYQRFTVTVRPQVTAVYFASEQAPAFGFRLTGPFPGTDTYSTTTNRLWKSYWNPCINPHYLIFFLSRLRLRSGGDHVKILHSSSKLKNKMFQRESFFKKWIIFLWGFFFYLRDRFS